MHIFLIPFLFDYVLYGVFFITAYNMAQSGLNAAWVSSPMIIWGISYAVSAVVFGHLTTRENAGLLLQLSGWGTAAVSILFFCFSNVWMQLSGIFLMGIVAACYCVPFQIYAGRSDSNSGNPNRTAGLYTFSWSIGTAAGTLGFGCLPGRIGFAVNIGIGIFIALLVMFHKTQPQKKSAVQSAAIGNESVPDRMLAAWIFCGTAAFVMALVSALVPLRGVEIQLGKAATGAILSVIRFTQGFMALALILAGPWLFQRKAFVSAAFFGASGLLLMTQTASIPLFAGAFSFGIFSGMFYFYLVFHAVSHPEKCAKYVGVNELLLGFTGIVGPAVGGAVVQTSGTVQAFAGCAGITVISALIAILTGWRRK